MPSPRDQRHLAILLLLATVICASLALIALDVNAASVKEVLAIVFPPIVALVAAGVGEGGRR